MFFTGVALLSGCGGKASFDDATDELEPINTTSPAPANPWPWGVESGAPPLPPFFEGDREGAPVGHPRRPEEDPRAAQIRFNEIERQREEAEIQEGISAFQRGQIQYERCHKDAEEARLRQLERDDPLLGDRLNRRLSRGVGRYTARYLVGLPAEQLIRALDLPEEQLMREVPFPTEPPLPQEDNPAERTERARRQQERQRVEAQQLQREQAAEAKLRERQQAQAAEEQRLRQQVQAAEEQRLREQAAEEQRLRDDPEYAAQVKRKQEFLRATELRQRIVAYDEQRRQDEIRKRQLGDERESRTPVDTRQREQAARAASRERRPEYQRATETKQRMAAYDEQRRQAAKEELQKREDAQPSRGHQCFIAGTAILTPDEDEPLKPIESLKKGHEVWSCNTGEGKCYVRTIESTSTTVTSHLVLISTKNVDDSGSESTLETTPEHPFYKAGETATTLVRDLRKGDILRGHEKTRFRITRIQERELPDPIFVYNFQVDGEEGNNNYFAGEHLVLVHNCGIAQIGQMLHGFVDGAKQSASDMAHAIDHPIATYRTAKEAIGAAYKAGGVRGTAEALFVNPAVQSYKSMKAAESAGDYRTAGRKAWGAASAASSTLTAGIGAKSILKAGAKSVAGAGKNAVKEVVEASKPAAPNAGRGTMRTTAGEAAKAAEGVAVAGSALEQASQAALQAAERISEFTTPAKHLPGAGGNWTRFAARENPTTLIQEALRAKGAQFFPNNRGDSFKVIYDFGRVIGERGETSIRVIFGTGPVNGRVWTAFPQ